MTRMMRGAMLQLGVLATLALTADAFAKKRSSKPSSSKAGLPAGTFFYDVPGDTHSSDEAFVTPEVSQATAIRSSRRDQRGSKYRPIPGSAIRRRSDPSAAATYKPSTAGSAIRLPSFENTGAPAVPIDASGRGADPSIGTAFAW